MRSLIVGLGVLDSPSRRLHLFWKNTKLLVLPADNAFLCVFISNAPKVVVDLWPSPNKKGFDGTGHLKFKVLS